MAAEHAKNGRRDRVPPPAAPARDKRVLPHSLESEASILGGIILQPSVLAQLVDLEVEDFYHWPHKIIFEAIRNLQAADKPIDIVMIEHEIDRAGKLASAGGVAYLGELALKVPTVLNVLSYVDTVRTLSRNRQLILELGSALERAYNWQHDPDELVSEVAGQLQRFVEIDRERAEPEKARWCVHLDTFLGDAEPDDDDAEDWVIRDIIPRGEPVVWGGPMKAGKTWAALDMAIAIALGEDWLGFENTLRVPVPVLGLCLEDSTRRLRKRIWELCRGRLRGQCVLTPNSDAIRQNLMISRASIRLPDAKDQRRLVAEIKARGVRFVVIDNLTRVMVGDPNKTGDASVFTRAWCEICEEAGAAVMFLHHTRKPFGGGDGKEVDPFENLRGSGDFGAAARNIIVATPIRQDDGPKLAEVRMRGNIDLRRDGFVMGFERDQLLGKWRAKIVDKGEIGTVKEEVSKQRREKKVEQKKHEMQEQTAMRRDRALAIVHSEGCVSQTRLAREFGLASARTMEPTLNGMVTAGILRRDKIRGYVLAEEPEIQAQEAMFDAPA